MHGRCRRGNAAGRGRSRRRGRAPRRGAGDRRRDHRDRRRGRHGAQSPGGHARDPLGSRAPRGDRPGGSAPAEPHGDGGRPVAGPQPGRAQRHGAGRAAAGAVVRALSRSDPRDGAGRGRGPATVPNRPGRSRPGGRPRPGGGAAATGRRNHGDVCRTGPGLRPGLRAVHGAGAGLAAVAASRLAGPRSGGLQRRGGHGRGTR